MFKILLASLIIGTSPAFADQLQALPIDPTIEESADPILNVNPEKSADCTTVAAINSKYQLLKYDVTYYRNHRAQNTAEKNKALLANILTKLHNVTFELAQHMETEEQNEHLLTVRTLITSVRDGSTETNDAVKKQIPTLINETSGVYKTLLTKTACTPESLALCPYNKLGQKIPADMNNEKARFHYEIQARLGNIDLKACVVPRPEVAVPIDEKLVEPKAEATVVPAPVIEFEESVIAQ